MFPAEEAGKRGDGHWVVARVHLGRERGQARPLLGPGVEARVCARLETHCQPRGRDCSLAETHSGSGLRNLASEFPSLPLPRNRRAGQASLSSVYLALPSLLVGPQAPLTHEWGTQEPSEAEAAETGGMEVCLLSLRVQTPSSALLQGTHTCRPAGSLQGPPLQPGAPQFPLRGRR